jgi:hypothetical protein
VNGTLTEYATSAKGNSGIRLFVFQFHRDGAAWLVVGMFNAGARDTYLADYEEMLTTVVFE